MSGRQGLGTARWSELPKMLCVDTSKAGRSSHEGCPRAVAKTFGNWMHLHLQYFSTSICTALGAMLEGRWNVRIRSMEELW